MSFMLSFFTVPSNMASYTKQLDTKLAVNKWSLALSVVKADVFYISNSYKIHP